MKKAFMILMTVLIAGMSACSSVKNGSNSDTVNLKGIVEELGMTTFQYGTHKLNAGGKTYALRSKNVNLDGYLMKSVRLVGSRVEGYPLEGGPELIEVLEISMD